MWIFYHKAVSKVPDRIQNRIAKIGGMSPDGNRPLFRMVWGRERLTVIGGAWKKYDSNGNEIGEVTEERWVPKYPNALDRFIIEMWCPPENYGTPEEWDRSFREFINGKFINVLGEFPRMGEYELVKVLETPIKKAFVPLTDAIVEACVTTAKLNKELPARIKVEAGRDRREKEEREKDERLAAIIENCERPWWAKQDRPHIVVPGSDVKSKGGIVL